MIALPKFLLCMKNIFIRTDIKTDKGRKGCLKGGLQVYFANSATMIAKKNKGEALVFYTYDDPTAIYIPIVMGGILAVIGIGYLIKKHIFKK